MYLLPTILLFTMKLTQLLREAHVDPPEAANLKGFAKHYNAITNQGRFNVGASTLGLVGLGIIYLLLKPKKKAIAPKK